MLFNSLEFPIFLIAFFLLYWSVFRRNLVWQNALIWVASYVFYGWWDWRFLALIAASTWVDFMVGIRIARAWETAGTKEVQKRRARSWLGVSIAANLGLLVYFKYANFFMDNWIALWSNFGLQVHPSSMQVILPVGISFYTFQTLSYSIDIYRKELKPTKDFIAFAAFVSFFPQLVAGPIERARSLLPQIESKRIFESGDAKQGIRLIIWGLFKKVVIADTCAVHANELFANYGDYGGLALMLGALYFAFQIYGDFSGYSDIAIGTARLFGIRLMTNFKTPYFSRNIAEFWRRWHISLSTWFRDYVYIPLGGSRSGKWKSVRNTFVIFLVSGFWHGANWTFLVWGGIHAILFLPLLLGGLNRKYTDDIHYWPSGREVMGMMGTFSVVVVGWVFFRSNSLADAMGYLTGFFGTGKMTSLIPLAAIGPFCVLEIALGRKVHTGFSLNGFWRQVGWGVLLFLVVAIGYSQQQQAFIYFQF
jgi:alginate O-acetyltransferase complex protein AlgI